jgi:hypothetical protein
VIAFKILEFQSIKDNEHQRRREREMNTTIALLGEKRFQTKNSSR